jgi:amidohydrolase
LEADDVSRINDVFRSIERFISIICKKSFEYPGFLRGAVSASNTDPLKRGYPDMAVIDQLKEKIRSVVDELKSNFVEIADHIFDNPELGTKEHGSKRYLVDFLKEHGFTAEEGVGSLETSFRAEYDTKKKGPVVAFIAEYDALPKMGHACHHHAIAASSVGAAVAMCRIGADLCGKIVCIGTPAEELFEAKDIMASNGAFEGVDAVLMFHGGCKNNMRLIALAIDGLEFAFKGKSAHAAAAPHEGINALDAVLMLFNSVNALRQQLKPDVRIHGNVTKGGDAVNIIPETAAAQFNIRARQRKYLNEVVAKVKNCARGAALQTGTELEISEIEDPGSDLLMNDALIGEFEKNLLSLGEKIDPEPFLLGSSDIGNLSYKIPALHPMVKTAPDDCALHTDKMVKYGKSDIAHHGMLAGLQALAMTGVRVLMDPAFLDKIKEDFKEKTKGM